MNKPKICVSIIDNDLEAIKEIEPLVDMFEVRLDLVGESWLEIAKYLQKPWIACNRRQEEGGRGNPNDVKREEELLWAAEAGASIVDIEYGTKNIKDFIPLIKSRAKLLISFHDVMGTPGYETLAGIARDQIRLGADICKIITTANNFEDNLTVLKLVHEYPETKMISFAMGETGRMSRVMCPLVGGYLTYACIDRGKEAADGQITIQELKQLYEYLK
jgi:3-dehydroquinate dehydratase-1